MPNHRADPDAARRGWPDDDPDDLDRAFGPDTSSVPTRTRPQRIRAWSVLAAGVLVVAAVIVVALTTIVSSVQTGVGGVFPDPDATTTRFVGRASTLDGVEAVRDRTKTHVGLASWDVGATIDAAPTLSQDGRSSLVNQLSDAIDATAGNGVRVFAHADFGDVVVGVSASGRMSVQRLELAQQLRALDGAGRVTCGWTDGDERRGDTPADQAVTVETSVTDGALDTLRASATADVHAVFPAATVTVRPTAA